MSPKIKAIYYAWFLSDIEDFVTKVDNDSWYWLSCAMKYTKNRKPILMRDLKDPCIKAKLIVYLVGKLKCLRK